MALHSYARQTTNENLEDVIYVFPSNDESIIVQYFAIRQ